MALVKADRVKETSTTTGVGTYTLAGAVAGFQSFAAIGNGNTCHYFATDSASNDWEVGIGTYTSSGTTLARTTVLASSNSNSAVNWTAGTRTISVGYPASKAVTTDGAETLTNKSIAYSQLTGLGTGVATALGNATNSSGGPVTGGAITSSGLTQSTARLLGRTTASTGAVEEISVSGATLSGGTLTISGTANPGICNCRLTLSSGNPVYAPKPVVAVSGQDTTNDTITVTAHGWTVGTMVKSSATSGGLTAGTQYYAGNITTNTITLHTTVAAALAGTSKVDITGTVTANIVASGVANTTIYMTPFGGNLIALYDGSSTWSVLSFSELSLSLGTLSSGKPYDVFAYNNSGTVALRSPVAWTDDTTRATALVLQDGVWVKSGATTDRYIGTFYTDSTTTTQDSLAKRFVWNRYNQQWSPMMVVETAGTWTYTTDTFRQANANTANQLDYVTGDALTTIEAMAMSTAKSTVQGVALTNGIGVDSTSTIPPVGYHYGFFAAAVSGQYQPLTARYVGRPGVGRHYLALLERSVASGTTTWLSDVGGGAWATSISSGLFN